MLRAASGKPGAARDLRVHFYPLLERVILGGLVALSGGSLPLLLVLGLRAAQPISLVGWVRTLSAFSVLPAVTLWLIARAHAGQLEIRDGVLTASRRRLRIEIPCTSIERVVPWRVPMPGPGFSLRMRSGRRFRYSFQVADPTAILSTLADAGGVESARSAEHHPTLLYARAKHRAGAWRWHHRLAKFGLFALVPTAVWFNAHQHIAYGVLLGQYYLEGLGPYLETFTISWGLASIYLVLYASAWRALAEGVCFLAAWISPARAMPIRWAAEITCKLVYYVGVPVIVVVPFLR